VFGTAIADPPKIETALRDGLAVGGIGGCRPELITVGAMTDEGRDSRMHDDGYLSRG
jgi:hypothetical protein